MIQKIGIYSIRRYIGDWFWGTWLWVHVKAGGESLLWSPGQLAWAMVGQWCRLTSGPVHRWTLNNMTWETWDMLRWLIKSLSLNLTNKLRSSIHPRELGAAVSVLCVLMISVRRMEKCVHVSPLLAWLSSQVSKFPPDVVWCPCVHLARCWAGHQGLAPMMTQTQWRTATISLYVLTCLNTSLNNDPGVKSFGTAQIQRSRSRGQWTVTLVFRLHESVVMQWRSSSQQAAGRSRAAITKYWVRSESWLRLRQWDTTCHLPLHSHRLRPLCAGWVSKSEISTLKTKEHMKLTNIIKVLVSLY